MSRIGDALKRAGTERGATGSPRLADDGVDLFEPTTDVRPPGRPRTTRGRDRVPQEIAEVPAGLFAALRRRRRREDGGSRQREPGGARAVPASGGDAASRAGGARAEGVLVAQRPGRGGQDADGDQHRADAQRVLPAPRAAHRRRSAPALRPPRLRLRQHRRARGGAGGEGGAAPARRADFAAAVGAAGRAPERRSDGGADVEPDAAAPRRGRQRVRLGHHRHAAGRPAARRQPAGGHGRRRGARRGRGHGRRAPSCRGRSRRSGASGSSAWC